MRSDSATPMTPIVVAQAKNLTPRPWAISMNSGTSGIRESLIHFFMVRVARPMAPGIAPRRLGT